MNKPKKWNKIDDTGLPPPGMYFFKNEETQEVIRSVVRLCPNGSTYCENVEKATHWLPYEEGIDAAL